MCCFAAVTVRLMEVSILRRIQDHGLQKSRHLFVQDLLVGSCRKLSWKEEACERWLIFKESFLGAHDPHQCVEHQASWPKASVGGHRVPD